MTNWTTARVVMAGTVLMSFWSAAAAGENVHVRLQDGTSIDAELDQRTNADRLWLRFGGGATIVLRSIAWKHVALASHRGKRVSPAELRKIAATANSRQAVQAATETTSVVRPMSQQATQAELARRMLGTRSRVSDVRFDAVCANWDRDVEADGLQLLVTPIDVRGLPALVNGVLDVELVAMKTVAFHHAPHSRGQLPRRLGRWTQRLGPTDFVGNGAVVKLPFQASHPEFDTKWAPYSILHVRLVIPGHGVFERSVDGIRTRPFAPMRDRLERQSTRRFLPSEATSAGQ